VRGNKNRPDVATSERAEMGAETMQGTTSTSRATGEKVYVHSRDINEE